MSKDKDRLLYWPKYFSRPLQHFFRILARVAQPGVTKGPKPSICSWFSLWHPVSNWLEPPGHLVILFSNTHLLPLFFRLFTQVHLLIDGSVEGQYITPSLPYYLSIAQEKTDRFMIFPRAWGQREMQTSVDQDLNSACQSYFHYAPKTRYTKWVLRIRYTIIKVYAQRYQRSSSEMNDMNLLIQRHWIYIYI